MYPIYDPISGEKGYFCSESEKTVIVAVVSDYAERNQLVTTSPSESGCNE